MFQIEQIRNQIAGEVRATMARERVSAKRVSQLTGIPASTLSRKVNGEIGFTVEELLRVAHSLGVAPSQFLPDNSTDKAAS